MGWLLSLRQEYPVDKPSADYIKQMMIWRYDCQMAAMILTRVPMQIDYPPDRNIAMSYWAFPLIGILVAGISAVPGAILLLAGVPALAVAAVMLGVAALLTGGMHEDGLADMADSLGGHDPASRLQIMRDSRIGAFGVIALVLVLVIKLACLAELAQQGVTTLIGAWLAASVLSRAMMALQAWSYPPPDESGFAHSVGRPDQKTMLIAMGLGLGLAVLLSASLMVFLAAGFAVLITFLIGAAFHWHLGGINGDGLGATQMLSAAVIFMVMAIA